jgi:ATP/maltotriose-dependent transcriptional regulator MalT
MGDEFGLSRAWSLLAEVHWMRGRFGDMERVLERALEHAERAGAERESAALLGDIARVLRVGPTPAEVGIRRCEEILDRRAGDPQLEAIVSTMVAGLQTMRGRFEVARRLYGRSKKILEELGLAVPLARMALYAGPSMLLAGEPKTAERELRSGYETFEAMGEKARLSTIAAFLARAVCEQGRYDEAERLTEVSEESASRDDLVSQVVWRQTRAKLLALRGELEAGMALAREAVALAADTDYLNMHGDALLDLAEVLRRSNDPDGAVEAVVRARELFEAKGNLVSAGQASALLAELAGEPIA